MRTRNVNPISSTNGNGSSNDTVDLLPVGDVELWFAEGPDWMLPLYVEWKQNTATKARYGVVITPFVFYNAQLMAINALLGEHAMEVKVKTSVATSGWLLYENMVKALLHKAPGINAEFYYKWPDKQPPIPTSYRPRKLDPAAPPVPRRLDRYKAFASYVAAERHLPEDVVLMVLTAISQLGGRWLMQYRKTLDLGFVRLVALPFRVNWKEVVVWKCKPWKILTALRAEKDQRDRVLAEHRFAHSLCSVHNIGLTSRPMRRLEYTIEVIQTPEFEKIVNEVEMERVRCGSTAYVSHYEKMVERYYKRIVEVLSQYAHKVVAPWVRVRPSSTTGILAFVPVHGKVENVRGVSLTQLPAHIVPPVSDFSVMAETGGDPHLVQGKADEVQKMSGVSPPIDDMRERDESGDLDEP